MLYPLFLTFHLFAALIFIGTVFFEVLFLESIRKQLPAKVMLLVEEGIGRRARTLMPWVLLVLFGAGLGMVWLRYLPVLATPMASSFSTLLLLKILVAVSVLLHFLAAMFLFKSGRMNARYLHFIHASVFYHMVVIVLLAKGMFYLTW
ncbi:CopD family copper resistance protein [Pseudomonas farris]